MSGTAGLRLRPRLLPRGFVRNRRSGAPERAFRTNLGGRRQPRVAWGVIVGLAVVALTGCSQLAAIAPVGGTRLVEVRNATNDILLRQNVDIGAAAVCTAGDGSTITCAGSTLDGKAITSTTDADDPDTLTVKVGGDTLFTGSILKVLDEAMQP
jgi:hypothetical protein